MRRRWSIACLGVGIVLAESADQREIRKTEREWLNCYLTRDASVMERIEADEFRIVYSDGRVLTKKQELENLKNAATPQADVTMDTEGETVHIYGNTAVVTGNFIQRGHYKAGPRNGQSFHIVNRYTDVYVKRDGNWQVAASQLTAVVPEPLK